MLAAGRGQINENLPPRTIAGMNPVKVLPTLPEVFAYDRNPGVENVERRSRFDITTGMTWDRCQVSDSVQGQWSITGFSS